jgi:hypothetical protein
MMTVDAALLRSVDEHLAPRSNFHATLEAHGVYDSLRYVVRLSPLVHAQLATLPDGIGFTATTSQEQLFAYSTYLHETVHWWQHIGSTCGLMLSLSHPAQTHANLGHLQRLLAAIGPVKSIYEYAAATQGTGSGDPETPEGIANIIVNNRFDMQAYRFLATNPADAAPFVHQTLFESMGHAYHIAMGQGMFAIANTVDRGFDHLPHPDGWQGEYHKLCESRHPGFYYGSPLELSSVGAYEIFEGQARFVQLQYLHFATGGRFEWDDAERLGMMGAVYTEAFEAFLRMTGLTAPASIDDPVTALFLLICDIAMNPGEGFTLPIWSSETFLIDVDPGLRFIHLCSVVRQFCPWAATAIRTYSRDEYEQVSEALCDAFKIYSPLLNCRAIARWVANGGGFRDCLARRDAGAIGRENAAIDLLFGQFLSYSRDKLLYPHILCWPGAAMAGRYASGDSVGVFSRQSPLFVDRADDEMIAPVVRAGLDEAVVYDTFQIFYGTQSVYDMTYQWVVEPGDFTYDYRWLQPAGTPEQMKQWAAEGFRNLYGISPDDFHILSAKPAT